MPQPRTHVDFWFDPRCPWAWITSRWIKEVEQVRDVETRFHVMSLTYLNETTEISDEYRQRLADGWRPVRVVQAAIEEFGEGVVDRLYTELGTRFHDKQLDQSRATIESALEAAGLPLRLAEAMDDSTYDAAIRKSHNAGMDQVGPDVGTPVIAIDGAAIFGPVVTPIPRGDEAARLWDGVRLVMSVPGFYELKRGRTESPTFQ